MNETKATIIHPKSGKLLAHISMVNKPIQTNALICTSGSLQEFIIISETSRLWEAWVYSQVVLLRTGNTQQMVKIISFPTDGENQAYLEIIPGTKEYYNAKEEQHQPKRTIQKGFTFLKTLLGAKNYLRN